MSRIRTIKPDFWTDEKIVDMSAMSRLLFIGLWNFADDEGKMQYSPKKIKMQILPSDNIICESLLEEIESFGLIQIYAVENSEYIIVCNFSKHQKVDKRTASKYPNPPEFPRAAPNPPEFPRAAPTEGKGREGKGRDLHTHPLGKSSGTLNATRAYVREAVDEEVEF